MIVRDDLFRKERVGAGGGWVVIGKVVEKLSKASRSRQAVDCALSFGFLQRETPQRSRPNHIGDCCPGRLCAGRTKDESQQGRAWHPCRDTP